MKEFYFSCGNKISKEEYIFLKQNNEKKYNSIFQKTAENINEITSITRYDKLGNQFKYNKDEIDELKEKAINSQRMKIIGKDEIIPLFYCDENYIIIEIPNEYDYCKLSFLNGLEGKLLRMETPKNLFDYPLNDFGKDPVEMKKNNGILIFK